MVASLFWVVVGGGGFKFWVVVIDGEFILGGGR